MQYFNENSKDRDRQIRSQIPEQKQKKVDYNCLLLFVIVILLLAGCASQGPKRIPADRFNYNAAIAQSTREQMLLNIVRSRYLEVPVFLTVSSVLSQYEYTGSLGVAGSFGIGDNSADTVAGDANLGYSERPTITFLPVEGQEFSAHLLSPIPSEWIFAAAQAGWPIDVFMRIGLQRIGIAENMSFGEVPASKSVDQKKHFENNMNKLKRFERIIQLIFILADREIIEAQQVIEDGKSERYLVIAEEVPEDLRSMLDELRQNIGLINLNRFKIVDRVTNADNDEISIIARSVMAIMEFMARGVEVPAEHLKEGRVVDYGLQNSEGKVTEGLIPFRMHSSKNRPDNVFAAVRFQDHWFYIAHNDITSKRALSLIIILFRLQAPSPAGAAPILTVPTR